MKSVYLDNAATTPLDRRVLEEMLPYMEQQFGNPSSIHSHGRVVRSAIEKARKTVAGLLNCAPAEIFFTSGGTEADNFAIRNAVECFGLKHIITSAVEHHAVLHTVEALEHEGKIKAHYLTLDTKGCFELAELEALLKEHPVAMVCLMHGNNEIANLAPINEIGMLCQEYKAFFHSDTVQTVGHYVHNLQQLPLNYMVGAGHKFHGPKGVGFIYMRGDSKLKPMIFGGAQERNVRGGTENVYGIIGLAKALELAYAEMEQHQSHIKNLKAKHIEILKHQIPGIEFNGNSAEIENSLYTVLSVSTPSGIDNEMLLFNLDIKGVSASGGSACSSGSQIGSHVMAAINKPADKGVVRFSYSRFTTPEEIVYASEVLTEICGVKEPSL